MSKASNIITKELFDLKPGEIFIITGDTESDPRVVEATARAAFTIGAKPMVIWLAAPISVGKAVDDFFSDKNELPIPMPDKSGSVLIVKQ